YSCQRHRLHRRECSGARRGTSLRRPGRNRGRRQGPLHHRDDSLAAGAAAFVNMAAAPGSSENARPEILRTATSRILIVRLGAMGDIIHGLPAVTALRTAFPESTLGWLVEERWTELLCTLSTPRSGPRSPQRPLVDRLHAVNTKRWRSAL